MSAVRNYPLTSEIDGSSFLTCCIPVFVLYWYLKDIEIGRNVDVLIRVMVIDVMTHYNHPRRQDVFEAQDA